MFSLLLGVGLASASSTYPGDVQSALSMPCASTCMLCHENNSGGGGTVTQPFGMALMDRGLTGGGNAASLSTALDAMATDAVDSDGDGVIDVDELAAGDNPNDATSFCSGDVLVPTYGCLGYVPVSPEGARWAWLAGVGVALAVSRLRAYP